MNHQVPRERKTETAARILAAAAAVFSEVGFAGARVDEIALRAGVNKATLYYHIGDKETLYTEVIHHVIGNTAETIAREIKEVESPEEKLRIYIRAFVSNIEAHPQMAPIMMREVASGGRYFPEVVARDIFRIVGMLTEILEEGVRKGVFAETVPFIIHLMVVGSIVIFAASGPLRARIDCVPEALKKGHLELNDEIVREIETLILKAVQKEKE